LKKLACLCISNIMNVDNLEVTDLLSATKLAEVSERYQDMCKFLHKLVETKCESKEALSNEERNLLSVGFKNVVGTMRQSWRMITQGGFDNIDNDTLDKYKELIEKELEETCKEVIDLLEKTTEVARDVSDDEAKENLVFYLKMSGDYYRYLSEFKPVETHQKTAEKYYQEAIELANEHLPETHPTRLGLALNFSVCCYEILDQKEYACKIAKEAFDSAIEKLDTLNDSSYKDSTLIMQLLRDNLTLWTTEKEEEAQEDK